MQLAPESNPALNRIVPAKLAEQSISVHVSLVTSGTIEGRAGAGPDKLLSSGLTGLLDQLGFGQVVLGSDIREAKNDPLAHAVPDELLEARLQRISNVGCGSRDGIFEALNSGHRTLSLGGDHASSLGSLAGVLTFCKKHELKLGVVVVDAHGDFHLLRSENDFQPVVGGPRNPHGMWEAAACGFGHPLLTEVMNGNFLDPKLLLQLGVNAIEPEERDNLLQHGVNTVTRDGNNLFKGQFSADSLQAIHALRSEVDVVAFFFDVDAGSRTDFPATPMPNAYGLPKETVFQIARAIGVNEPGLAPLIHTDICEFDPEADVPDPAYANAEYQIGTTELNLQELIAQTYAHQPAGYFANLGSKREAAEAAEDVRSGGTEQNELLDSDFPSGEERLDLLLQQVNDNRSLRRREHLIDRCVQLAKWIGVPATVAAGFTSLALMNFSWGRGQEISSLDKDPQNRAVARRIETLSSTLLSEASEPTRDERAFKDLVPADAVQLYPLRIGNISRWNHLAQKKNVSYEEVEALFIRSFSKFAKEYEKICSGGSSSQKTQGPLVNSIQAKTDQDKVRTDLSAMYSTLYVALGHLSPQQHLQLQTDAVRMGFAKGLNADPQSEQVNNLVNRFNSDWKNFRTGVTPQIAGSALKRLNLVPQDATFYF